MPIVNNFRINPASFPGSFTQPINGADLNRAAKARADQQDAQDKAEQAKAAGPATPQGRAIAARNATTHGLFARDVVLPHLGEDSRAYDTLYLQFCEQIEPRGLLETHYVEAIAAASWRLRRLHRWQAQVWEDDTLTEDARLDKLDRVLRHEAALHREINTSVRLLGREVPELFAGRARKQALADLEQTERDCRHDDEAERDVALRAAEYMQMMPLPASFDRASLDNTYEAGTDVDITHAPEPPAAAEGKCQNDLGMADAEAPAQVPVEAEGRDEPAPASDETGNCQNELAPVGAECRDELGAALDAMEKRRNEPAPAPTAGLHGPEDHP